MGHREAFPLQYRLDQSSLCRIVIDDQDRFGHENTHPEWLRPSF